LRKAEYNLRALKMGNGLHFEEPIYFPMNAENRLVRRWRTWRKLTGLPHRGEFAAATGAVCHESAV
jgi:hypothetical protein